MSDTERSANERIFDAIAVRDNAMQRLEERVRQAEADGHDTSGRVEIAHREAENDMFVAAARGAVSVEDVAAVFRTAIDQAIEKINREMPRRG
jgi:hypothetical protein